MSVRQALDQVKSEYLAMPYYELLNEAKIAGLFNHGLDQDLSREEIIDMLMAIEEYAAFN